MNELLTQAQNDFAQAVLAGLSQPQKVVPARFLYDKRGSELFEDITQLPDYYLTRTETALLEQHASDIAALVGEERVVVEFGSGSSAKTPLLLAAVRPTIYIPVDISADFLAEAAKATADAHPGLRVVPVAGDFTLPVYLDSVAGNAPRLGFFPGGTIGNFGPAAAVDLLRSFATTLGRDARLVIGVDPRKDSRLLTAAAHDSGGLMQAFNRNLLERINRELGGTIDVAAFTHKAVWNDELGRLELHLEAERDLEFTVAGRLFVMRAGETIHSENSYKYRPEEIQLLARVAGWKVMAAWSDPDGLFSLQVWRAKTERIEP
jgi:dimethylhistidine N-methyltransferase